MAKVPRFAEAFAGRWPIAEMDNRDSDFTLDSVLQQPARRRWGLVYYIYLAVTFTGVTALVFLCLVALEMVIG